MSNPLRNMIFTKDFIGVIICDKKKKHYVFLKRKHKKCIIIEKKNRTVVLNLQDNGK